MLTHDWLTWLRDWSGMRAQRRQRATHARTVRHGRSHDVQTLESRLQLSISTLTQGWAPLAELPALEPGQVSYLRADDYAAFQLNIVALASILETAPMEFAGADGIELQLPSPDGGFDRFEIVESPIMAPELAAAFPEIKTYAGQGIDDPLATLRLDLTPQGFHAQVLTPNGAYYVDPYIHLGTEFYASYFRSDMNGSGISFVEEELPPAESRDSGTSARGGSGTSGTGSTGSSAAPTAQRSGAQLRTYRAAVAASGEYTAFHGGTQALGQAAIVTAINRVTGIYESELTVRLQLVANNNQLVYTNASTDPYTNNNPSALLTENQANIDTVIGNANYDIGHVFTTGGGGLAGLGVVGITGQKARGETGLSSPTGDAFYVDYVAHEMGHQFGGNHTFNENDSNRNAGTAYEPGSGSTIMAYAGLFGADNLQLNSDPYFHSASFDEIINHVDNVIPAVGTRTSTGNSVPTVSAGLDYVIPARTPFALTATGSDSNSGDVLTYSWEERDLGPAQSNILTAGDNGSSPIFRVFNPTTSPTRTFPRLSDLLNNTTVIGETLPTTTRTMNYRVTVRDNVANGGALNTDDMQLSVVDTGAAFAVTSPNAAVTLGGLTTQVVTWNVAGTTGNGIFTQFVNILLSTDGGNTFPTVLKTATRNDGSESIVLPNTSTTQARIKVEAVGNVFFDVSNANFTITSAANTRDYGDAQGANYGTTGGAAASHLITGPRLGDGLPDGEADGQPNAAATGDGSDENGVIEFEPLVAGTTANIQVTVSGAAPVAFLNYFFDFNNDGDFADVNEIFAASLGNGTSVVQFAIPNGVSGPIYARFRISSVGGLIATGGAASGEVEDYRFNIFANAQQVDYGDAPDTPYKTLKASDGARHLAVGPQLGATRDGETDGLQNPTSTGDGTDEDGITFPEIFRPGATVPIRVTSSVGGGQLNAFFDWNRNGVWGDVGNEIVDVTLSGGAETFNVTVPNNVSLGTTYARFRISTGGALLANGYADNGEVEDYQILVIDPFEATSFQNFDAPTPPRTAFGLDQHSHRQRASELDHGR